MSEFVNREDERLRNMLEGIKCDKQVPENLSTKVRKNDYCLVHV